MTEQELSACVELACKLNNDPEVYDSFQAAMVSNPGEFASWLSNNGVPLALAEKLSTQTGDELAKTVGDVLTERFW